MKDFMGTMELERLSVRERRFAVEIDAIGFQEKNIAFGIHFLISSLASRAVSLVI